ncbi:hypothetical protein IFM89_019682 [Coptis chinensis]|uniref:NAD(P)-binding domain-containing protein n=1 Tax=Coptis chinensis TaxID=261450 RepID=A0A835HKY6_9MAGN|nr:hypothetical protein IFM89_019682 [Coptis chinensis]
MSSSVVHLNATFTPSSSSSYLPRAIPTRPITPRRRYPSLNRLCRLISVSCTYAEANTAESFASAPIDVVADVRTERIVVLGGNGFVGSAICKAAVSRGFEVVSMSRSVQLITVCLKVNNHDRSGQPSYSDSWVDQVTWIAGTPLFFSVRLKINFNRLWVFTFQFSWDVFYANWDDVLVGATAVVSTIGGFGNEEQMKRINGEANVLAVDAAKEYGVPKFILISVHDYNLPSFLLSSGYFTGKRKAEAEVLSKYPNSGVVLRPGFIYGKRKVDGFEIPLDLVGEPLEKFLSASENFTKPLSSLPASDLLLAPPISVGDVALAVVNAVTDDDFFGVFTIEQIKEAAAKVRV